MHEPDHRPLSRRMPRRGTAQRGRDLHERSWLDRFAAMLPEGGTILDIGCGVGEPIARYLIERGFAVTGVDSRRR